MATSETFGERLRFARELAGIPARELDRLAGKKWGGHTALIESGARPRVEAETAIRYAGVLGLSLDWLMNGDGRLPSAKAVKAAIEQARLQKAG